MCQTDPLGNLVLTKNTSGPNSGFILTPKNRIDTLTADQSQLLAEIDIDNVQNSWHKIEKSNFKLIGMKFMLRIFTNNEHIKPLWRFARDLNTYEDMISSHELKNHGERVFNAINLVVSKLRSPNEVNSILVQLGFNHYFYGAREEHIPVILYFSLFL